MKFSILTMAALAGSVFAAPAAIRSTQTIPFDFQSLLEQLPAILEALQGLQSSLPTANITLPVPTGTPSILPVPEDLTKLLEEVQKEGTVAAERVKRASDLSGLDISDIFEQIIALIEAFLQQFPGLPTDLPTSLPISLPTGLPTDLPTGLPTPTGLPSGLPTDLPTVALPTPLPTDILGADPTAALEDALSDFPFDISSLLEQLPTVLSALQEASGAAQ